MRPVPKFAVDGWAWVYNSPSTIRQSVRASTGAKVLKAKLALNRTGPYKLLAVGPYSPTNTPDSSSLGDNLLYLGLPSDLPGSDARRRMAIESCKPCANPRHGSGMLKHPPEGLPQYVLSSFSKKSPPYHVTQSRRRCGSLQRLEVENITGHQSVRGRGVVIAVLYETHWVGLSDHPWSKKWTSNTLAPIFCVVGSAPRTNTTEPTAFTAGCALARTRARIEVRTTFFLIQYYPSIWKLQTALSQKLFWEQNKTAIYRMKNPMMA